MVTIGDAHDRGWRLYVQCDRRHSGLKSVRPCVGRHQLDLRTMVWTHGRNCPLDWLNRRVRCPRCGTLDVLMIWMAPGGADLLLAGE